jgi:hypothetical protein
MSRLATFAVAATESTRYLPGPEKEQPMKKLTVIAKELLTLNFRQAYEVFHCKCNCWDSMRR